MADVLILGAGVYQVPLIRRARAAGHRVIAASWSAADPGMATADEAWVVDTRDRDALLARARPARLDAVLTTGTDVAMPSLGHLCDELGLAGPSLEVALRCTDKVRMKACFQAGGVRTAPHRRVRTAAEAARAADEIGYPVIIKAPDSSGSRGITAVHAPADLPPACAAALAVSRSGEILVERLLQGLEFGGQLVVIDGEVRACFLHNDTVTPPPVSVPIGHSVPFRGDAQVVRDAAAVCADAVRALGVRTAVCNVDLIATADGVYVLELGARIGATGIPEIIHRHTGVDSYALALEMALGKPVRVPAPAAGPAAAVLIIRAPATGRLARCAAPAAVRARPGVDAIEFDYAPGAAVRAFQTGPDRIGAVFTTADTADEAERRCAQTVADLDLAVTPDGA